MEEGESKSISVIDNKLGAAFLRAETDQKVLEEKAKKMNYEMPISTVLNEKIEQIKEELKQKDLENEHKQFPYTLHVDHPQVGNNAKLITLYDSHGDLIK